MTKRFLSFVALITFGFFSCISTEGDKGDVLVLDTLKMARVLRFELPKDSVIMGGMEYAQVSMRFVYPRENERVYYNLAKTMFAKDIDVSNPYATLLVAYSRFEDEFIELSPSNAEILRDTLAIELDRERGMYVELFNELVYSDAYIASFAIHQERYTGGVHGSQSTALCSFSLESGLPIGERDIFVDDASQELSTIIADEIVRNKGVKTKAELIDQYGIDIAHLSMSEEVLPNNNFLITKEGLRYCFNTYEIGPYSVGKIWVNIPWQSIAHLIKPNSIVIQYID